MKVTEGIWSGEGKSESSVGENVPNLNFKVAVGAGSRLFFWLEEFSLSEHFPVQQVQVLTVPKASTLSPSTLFEMKKVVGASSVPVTSEQRSPSEIPTATCPPPCTRFDEYTPRLRDETEEVVEVVVVMAPAVGNAISGPVVETINLSQSAVAVEEDEVVVVGGAPMSRLPLLVLGW